MSVLVAAVGLLTAVEVSPAPLPTALAWDATKLHADVAWNDKQATFVYRCVNTSDKAIRLMVSSDCGCTVTTPEPNPVPAGSAGTLTVVLPVGFRSGLVTKSVTVTTDPPSPQPTRLEFTAKIPVLATIRPGFLHWQVGDPVVAQQATVVLAPDFPLTITGIRASTSVLTAAWEPNPSKTAGIVRVTPRGTDLPWNGSVVITTSEGRDFVIFARCIAPDIQPSVPTAGHSK